ncbi:type II toxin-antitoxin system RelE/ParE family toxin [Paralysiella testudinis]
MAQNNPIAASEMERLLFESAERLSENPYSNRVGKVPGTREKIPHPNYIIVYRITPGKVEILNVVHSRKNYPN